MTRDDQVRALLASMFDYLPGPKVQRYGNSERPAASDAPCTTCAGTGKLGRRAPRDCGNCAGTGTVRVDPYTGEQVDATRRATAEDSRRIDAELARLARDADHRRGRHIDDRFAWEAERQRYRRAGSYAALEAALDSLRANLPDLHGLVLRCLVHGAVTPTADARPHLDAGVAWIANRMPPEIRVPPWVVEAPQAPPVREWPADRRKSPARVDRNATIIQLAADGMPGAKIAERVNVSPATVSRVLKTVAGTAA